PLAGHPAGGGALLGEAAAVHDQDTAGVAQFLGDMAAEFGHDGLVVPDALADEVLDRFAGVAGLVGDGLGGLALKAAEAALEDQGGQVALLAAVEQREVAPQELRQMLLAVADGGRAEDGVGQQFLGLGFVQQGHDNALRAPQDCKPSPSGILREKGRTVTVELGSGRSAVLWERVKERLAYW